MKALFETLMDGGVHYDMATEEAVDPVEEILRHGQERGEFRAFDRKVP